MLEEQKWSRQIRHTSRERITAWKKMISYPTKTRYSNPNTFFISHYFVGVILLTLKGGDICGCMPATSVRTIKRIFSGSARWTRMWRRNIRAELTWVYLVLLNNPESLLPTTIPNLRRKVGFEMPVNPSLET